MPYADSDHDYWLAVGDGDRFCDDPEEEIDPDFESLAATCPPEDEE